MNRRLTKVAQQRWDRIPPVIQHRLLDNVWCPTCRDSTTIKDYEGRIEQGDLVLSGKCAKCESPMARLIESG
jgi:hypothetical protein